MLEPWFPASLASSPHRIVQVRTGFDLEPALPDPAPAFADPDGALHPALLEGLSALPLHNYPTQAARSALVAQLLSEPGRPNPGDARDPFVAVYRFAVRQDMEAEVTGNLALLLIRGHLAQVQRRHRPHRPDPAKALLDPNNDPWRNRRARLHSTDWDLLWSEVEAAATGCSDSASFPFERINVLAGQRWLAIYRAWWQVAERLSDTELCPAEAQDCAALEATLAQVRSTCAQSLDPSRPEGDPGSAWLLDAAIALGAAAETDFMEATGSRPNEGLISARWLLNQQLRSLRHITLATREHSLRLHDLLRTSDIARVAAQVSYRLTLIELWLKDVRGESSRELEDALAEVSGPPHQSTLGAGLGRVQGAVLVRRLRRDEPTGALHLAEKALSLAPEELAVRMAWNDLRYHNLPSWDMELLGSLRAERDRWESLPVLIMGTRVAEHLGERSRARWFRDQLIARALNTDGLGPWALVVMETLAAAPGRERRQLLEHLEDAAEAVPLKPDAATWALFGSDEPDLLDDAFRDLRRAVSEALEDIEQAENLVPTRVSSPARKSRGSAWQQLVAKALPAASSEAFPGSLWSRIQQLRAAAPALRRAPLAARIRQLQELLSRAADFLASRQESLEENREAETSPDEAVAEITAACAGLSEVMTRLGAYLEEAEKSAATKVGNWLEGQIDPLRIAVREPRALQLEAELLRLGALARAQDRQALIAVASQLRAAVARARTADDGDLAFGEIDTRLSELRRSIYEGPSAAESTDAGGPQADSGTMVLHAEFERFSCEELGMLPDALRRALEMVRLFNLSGGRRDRKRLRGKKARDLFELRHRTAHSGGLRVFYERHGQGWRALAAMSKYDDRQQREAIERVRGHFQSDA